MIALRNRRTCNRRTCNRRTGNRRTCNRRIGNMATGNRRTGNKRTCNRRTGNRRTSFFLYKLFISFYIIKYNMRHTINTICRLLVGPLCNRTGNR